MSKRQPPSYWYGNQSVPWTARALAGVYGTVTQWRRKAYRKGWLKSGSVPVPVLVVGNLTTGGTGKTPTVIAIVKRLQVEGYRPGIASRGYGRSDEKQALRVTAETPIADSGDEPAMLARATGAPVQLDANRLAAARALVADGCDVIVCDDGLQHYALARDLEIEVIDADRRYGNAMLLPAGPLREPVERGDEVDFRILNWATTEPRQLVRGLWPLQYRYGDAVSVATGNTRSLDSFLQRRVHAVAGIGNPERFFEFLRQRGMLIIPHAFADHYPYAPADLQFEKALPVLMTSKDAVKCRAFAASNVYELPIEAQLPDAFWNQLLERVAQIKERRNPQVTA